MSPGTGIPALGIQIPCSLPSTKIFHFLCPIDKHIRIHLFITAATKFSCSCYFTLSRDSDFQVADGP